MWARRAQVPRGAIAQVRRLNVALRVCAAANGPLSKRPTNSRTKPSATERAGKKPGAQKRARSSNAAPEAKGEGEGSVGRLTSSPAADEAFDAALAKLAEKEAKFVQEFLVRRNASDAARAAGYSERSAGELGHRLLKKVDVQQALAAGKAMLAERYRVDLDAIVGELAVMAMSDAAEVATAVGDDGESIVVKRPADIALLPPRLRKMIAGWSWDKNGNFTLKFHDKKGALETLGKHYGMGQGDGGEDIAAALLAAMMRGKKRARRG